MKINIENLFSELKTDNQKLIEVLYDKYGLLIPGYIYSKKRNFWDGKKRFFSKKGKFRTGFLNLILEDLKLIGCTNPEIVQKIEDFKFSENYILNEYEYYPFQKELIEKALKQKRGIIKSPTGSGKTLILAGILKALENYTGVVLFNSKQILTQTYEFLTKECKLSGIGLCYGEGFILDRVMLCSVQSIQKILDTHLEESKFLIIDEVHEFCNGETTLAAIESFPNAIIRFGMTATPPSDKIKLYNLIGALGDIIESSNTKELIEGNFLTKPIIQIIERPASLVINGTYQDIYEQYITNNNERNLIIKSIVDSISSNNKLNKILILTKSLDHGRNLLNLMPGSEFLEGATSIAERYKKIKKFRKATDTQVLIGTKILETGVNISEITHFINARGLKSDIATLQALGRALRKHESKEVVYVYDFYDKEKYLLQHSKQRIKHYKQEGHEVKFYDGYSKK